MSIYHLSKEESERVRIVKYIAIVMVVYFHSYTTGVNFLDGTSVLALPVWLQAIEKGLSQVIAGCNVQIFSAFCNPAVPVRAAIWHCSEKENQNSAGLSRTLSGSTGFRCRSSKSFTSSSMEASSNGVRSFKLPLAKAKGFENSDPRSVRITGNSLEKVSEPNSFCRNRNTRITDSLFVGCDSRYSKNSV